MKAELRERILAYNRAMAQRKEKAEDMDVIAAALLALPPGQLKKLLTDAQVEFPATAKKAALVALAEQHLTSEE